MQRIVAVLLLLFSLGQPTASLADSAPPDKAVLKSLVEGQMEAFRRDDAGAAYDFASPKIRELFPTPGQFLSMVREAYPPVYRPATVAFGEIAAGPGGPYEKVYITAADGTGWIALYSFEQQADGSWKISGCRLLKDNAPTI